MCAESLDPRSGWGQPMGMLYRSLTAVAVSSLTVCSCAGGQSYDDGSDAVSAKGEDADPNGSETAMLAETPAEECAGLLVQFKKDVADQQECAVDADCTVGEYSIPNGLDLPNATHCDCRIPLAVDGIERYETLESQYRQSGCVDTSSLDCPNCNPGLAACVDSKCVLQ